jgi:hypothetical protein
MMLKEKKAVIKEDELTNEQRKQRQEWGHGFLHSLDRGLKMARGEISRPKQSLRESLEELIMECEESATL